VTHPIKDVEIARITREDNEARRECDEVRAQLAEALERIKALQAEVADLKDDLDHAI
jgi:predicted  nucleic acid-binding Zn-ribbon protein